MKMLLILSTVFLSVNSFAADKVYTCQSSNKTVVEFRPSYGELTMVDARGNTLIDQDVLTLGETKFFETSPSKTVTSIDYADEETAEQFGQLVKYGNGKVEIVLYGVVYKCN